MLEALRRRLTYANVMSSIAVFLALTGGAYAVTSLGRNTVKAPNIATNAVGSSEIRSRAVRRAEIAANSIDSSKIANGKLKAEDFAPGQLPTGTTGPPASASSSADLLDGIDSTGFVQGGGQVLFAASDPARGSGRKVFLDLPGVARLDVECLSDGTAELNIVTDSGSVTRIWYLVDEAPNAAYDEVSGGPYTFSTGDQNVVDFVLGKGDVGSRHGAKLDFAQVSSPAGGTPCHFQAHALVQSG